MNATQRKRFRRQRGPKPKTIVSQPYDLDVLGFIDSPYALEKRTNVIERSWYVAASVSINYYDVKRNRPEIVQQLLRNHLDSATLSVKNKCDEMMRQCWGSVLPRRRAA